MRLYFAAAYNSHFGLHGGAYEILNDHEKRERHRADWMLESYHYIHNPKYVDEIRKDGIKVFLDSGAFSAFTTGIDVDIKAYCDYCIKYHDVIEVASVLDGIGDPLKTWQNQKLMESYGVRPLPCFHYGEPDEYLIRYIEEYEYITLGGMVPISTPQLKLWLDRIWHEYLTDENGRPRIKVHGFGLTVIELMLRYPWFSVDSSSWLQISSFGNVLIPEFGIVCFSESSPQRKNQDRHFDNLAPIQQEGVRRAVESRGYEVERLRKLYHSRRVFNITAFLETVQDKHVDPTFKQEQILLF